MERLPGLVGEHLAGVDLRLAPGRLFCSLRLPPQPECRHRVRVEVDDPLRGGRRSVPARSTIVYPTGVVGGRSRSWRPPGAAIGAFGGIIVAPITLTNYDVGSMLALKAFAAAMLGGMGNPVGAVAGGLLLGLLEAFAAGYVSSQYKDAVAFIVILLVLFAMPQGLFGSSKVERV